MKDIKGLKALTEAGKQCIRTKTVRVSKSLRTLSHPNLRGCCGFPCSFDTWPILRNPIWFRRSRDPLGASLSTYLALNLMALQAWQSEYTTSFFVSASAFGYTQCYQVRFYYAWAVSKHRLWKILLPFLVPTYDPCRRLLHVCPLVCATS